MILVEDSMLEPPANWKVDLWKMVVSVAAVLEVESDKVSSVS